MCVSFAVNFLPLVNGLDLHPYNCVIFAENYSPLVNGLALLH